MDLRKPGNFADISVMSSPTDIQTDPRTGVVIVIVTYNSTKTIDRCLQSVIETISSEDEIVVVDNASRDETPIVLQRYAAEFPQIKVILSESNLGFSEGCNVGTRASVKEFVCLLNPDTIVTPTWIDRMKIPFLTEGVAAVGPLSDAVAGSQKIGVHLPKDFTGNFSYNQIAETLAQLNGFTHQETNLLIGFCVLFRRDVYESMGMLDSELFLGSDDLDISWRLRLAGHKLAIARDVFVHHENHVSFDSDPESKTAPLIQASMDVLGRKLIAHYGEGNVPSQQELWGIPWFSPSFSIWKETDARLKRLTIGYKDDSGVSIGRGCDIDWDLRNPIPTGETFQTERFGAVCLEGFESVDVRDTLEYSNDVVGLMTAFRDVLIENGQLTIRIPHHLAPECWNGDRYQSIFGPNAWDVFTQRPDLIGWTDFQFVPDGFNVLFSDFGSQLHFNRGLPIDQVSSVPRTIRTQDISFRKLPCTSRAPMTKMKQPPIVTMVFPVYKRPGMVNRQLDAIFAQTFTALEVFIIGDGCQEFETRLNDRYFQARVEMARSRGITIHAFNLSENHGSPHAIINYAIERGDGKYLMFAGDDDYMSPEHVANYVGVIEGTAWDAVMFDSNLIGDFYANQRESRYELGHVGHSEIIVTMQAARAQPPHEPGAFQDWEFTAGIGSTGKIAKANGATPTYHVNLTTREKHFAKAA